MFGNWAQEVMDEASGRPVPSRDRPRSVPLRTAVRNELRESTPPGWEETKGRVDALVMAEVDHLEGYRDRSWDAAASAWGLPSGGPGLPGLDRTRKGWVNARISDELELRDADFAAVYSDLRELDPTIVSRDTARAIDATMGHRAHLNRGQFEQHLSRRGSTPTRTSFPEAPAARRSTGLTNAPRDPEFQDFLRIARASHEQDLAARQGSALESPERSAQASWSEADMEAVEQGDRPRGSLRYRIESMLANPGGETRTRVNNLVNEELFKEAARLQAATDEAVLDLSRGGLQGEAELLAQERTAHDYDSGRTMLAEVLASVRQTGRIRIEDRVGAQVVALDHDGLMSSTMGVDARTFYAPGHDSPNGAARRAASMAQLVDYTREGNVPAFTPMALPQARPRQPTGPAAEPTHVSHAVREFVDKNDPTRFAESPAASGPELG